MKLFLLLLMWSPFVNAQLPLLTEGSLPVPRLSWPATPAQSSEIDIEDQNYSEKQITELAELLDRQFVNALEPLSLSASPACESADFENYVLALQVSGQFDRCAQIVTKCQNQISGPRPLFTAALCQSSVYNYPEADRLFALASDSRWRTSRDFTEGLFQRASYSLYGHHEDEVNGLLALIPNSTSEERTLWKALLQRVGEIDTGPIKKDQVDRFLESQISKTSGSFKGLLLSLQIRIAMRDKRHDDALKGLLTQAAQIENPLFWYSIGYSTLYYGLDQKFSWSRKIYDVYNRYANPWMTLPTENNTYSYSQLYASICKDQLVPEAEGREYRQLKEELRAGAISVVEAQKKMEDLKSRWGQKADFLTTLAGLFSLQGKHIEALEIYWQAHQLCPYYNRSHWGLVLEKRFFQYSRRPDYNQLNFRIERELKGRTIPAEISSYIVNWGSLTGDVQTRVAYGARIWLPFMGTLQSQENHSYIKYAFDLLSESPGLAELKDLRIGGSGYPHDNRLWDDVRGVGGSQVVADLGEVYQAVQGDYNLLGHEMAHQFQFLMEEIYEPGLKCIHDQYQKARSTKNFPDAYSSQNREEHFAQAVTYYLVPEDSPARFGLNQSWVRNNNPEQLSFIQSIDEAQGDLSHVSCTP